MGRTKKVNKDNKNEEKNTKQNNDENISNFLQTPEKKERTYDNNSDSIRSNSEGK
jgi:hypothetical protein